MDNRWVDINIKNDVLKIFIMNINIFFNDYFFNFS